MQLVLFGCVSGDASCVALRCAPALPQRLLRFAARVLARAQKRASVAGGRTREKTLAEELAQIGMSVGEELIEFLEMGLAGLEDPAKSKGSSSGASNTRSSSSSSSPKPPPPPPPRPAAPPPPPKAPLQSVDDMLAQMKKDMGL